MANIIRTVIQFRRAKTTEWEQYKHVVPAAGEPCYDIDLHTLKVGDGETSYGDLPVIGEKDEVSLSADGKSLILTDGVFKLAGFDEAAVGMQPRKAADGTIEWVVPVDEDVKDLKSTVAGLQTNVTNINNNVTNLETKVTNLQEIVTPSGDDAVPLLTRIETLETKMDGTGDGTVDAKIDAKINEFANQISDDGTVNTLKELITYVANHGGEVESIVNDITTLQDLVGNDPVHKQIDDAIANSGHMTKEEAEDTLLSKVEAAATYERVKYEIVSTPVGTLVNYGEKEIRVMCPADTTWAKQNVGATGNANMYYMGFKAYAPEGAVSFKEDDAEIISDQTMYYFENNDFAGVDKYGRKYSIVWLALASYDEATDTWTYFGAKSSTKRYIGWYYSVEWYDANGVKISSDKIRINLSNESCHDAIEPYYMTGVVKEVAVNGTLMDVVGGRVDITVPEIKGSDEIAVAEDGTLSVKSISIDKIVQDDESVLVMDGGGAV